MKALSHRRYFPTWIEQIAGVLQEFEGFMSIQPLVEIDHPERCMLLLLLRFERLDLVRQWPASPEHDDMIDHLTPYPERKQESQIFEAPAALK